MPSPPHAMLRSAHVTRPFQYRQLKTLMQVNPFPDNDAFHQNNSLILACLHLGALLSFVLNDVARSTAATPILSSAYFTVLWIPRVGGSLQSVSCDLLAVTSYL